MLGSKMSRAIFLGENFWRRGWESNPRIKVLQTSPLPLGYRAPELGSISKLVRGFSREPLRAAPLCYRLSQISAANFFVMRRLPDMQLVADAGLHDVHAANDPADKRVYRIRSRGRNTMERADERGGGFAALFVSRHFSLTLKKLLEERFLVGEPHDAHALGRRNMRKLFRYANRCIDAAELVD